MPRIAAKLESKNLDSSEEVRKFDKRKVELVNVAGAAVGRAHSSLVGNGLTALSPSRRRMVTKPFTLVTTSLKR